MPAELRVDVIGEMVANAGAMELATDEMWTPDGITGEDLAVFAGRACYQSWPKPNPKTADTKGYLAHIIEVGHLSVLRHAVVCVYIQGVSRTLTHELIRHHVGIDFSQLSQRYVDAKDMNWVLHPTLRRHLDKDMIGRWDDDFQETIREYERIVHSLEKKGCSRKQAREAARSILPNMTETKIVVTANLQAWRNFIAQRGTLYADAEIRELALEMARILKQGFPNAFQDMIILEKDGPAPAVVDWA